ncbi:MAG: recombinase family protein, partial [Eubacteriales bacterium]|nr:recombinase family protein [Eubacteriales bacterium]
KTRYYYYCKNTITASGHECSFRLNIDQAELNNAVAKIISAMVNKPRFAEAIQAKIGTAVDTATLEQQVEVLQGRLKQTLGTKTRLERQMDTLDIGDPHYDRKISDLQRRYDEQYDIMVEIESQIDELQSQIRSIRQEKISGDNIYRLLLAFDAVYNSATEAERKELMKAFIERIDLYPEKRKDGCWIRSIVFNFPMPVEGGEVKELSLESDTTVETVCLLSKLNTKQHIEVEIKTDELDLTAAESKATYDEIKGYVLEKHDLKVSSLYISQVKRKCGLDVGQNYNLSKKEDAKVPQCPPEKEAAIMEALKYFQMIH